MRKLKLDELNRATIAEFKEQQKLPVAVVLDNVRSMHNIGSIFRTSDGFAVEQVCLCGITAQPPHREIEKTALGATNAVDWVYDENTVDAVSRLRADGYKIIAIEQAENSTMLNNFEPNAGEKYALIFGNEVNGVSDEVMALIDGCIEIPQFGTKHSFNIVVSAGIVLWDFYAKIVHG
ncbi:MULTISPECIES: RNA methyltransferase [unclassified Mucilaginibacter]|uniref:RNA methyltransferase n=1 Tax=unclassified Mucilaginibacter TaxID=2617802 RepID=UPI00095ABC92|nr:MULTISPECIES: RNA methyltransferase [unclassified Mucilaginibacter]OJW14747.1 MAG: RNA methyltransferase [Mucilaginibacter sp. 44-25]PLW90161.1 MAG: RNA methyltransferase [Mucilaginibacter sp.]HEK21401.1 TrmH family RNA methyltransferase [Bacteroidota bacterium]